MAFKPMIPSDILSLLFEAGCVSRRAFTAMPYHPTRISGVLKSMGDDGLITWTGKRGQWRYRLLDKGRKRLLAVNPVRYGAEIVNSADLFYRQPERAVARGDVTALFSLAGYSVHPHDKPGLPYKDGLPDHPAQVYNNLHRHCYRSADTPDGAAYPRRTTPVNCYYDGLEVKRTAADQSKDIAPYKSARLSGVAYTPDHRVRVLYAQGRSMENSPTGDAHMDASLGYLVPGYRDIRKNAILVVGDRDFVTAMRLLEVSRDQASERNKVKRDTVRRLLSATSTDMDSFYIPLTNQAVPLLRIMQYPGWQPDLQRFAANQVFREAEMRPYRSCQCVGDGAPCYIGADLNLRSLHRFLSDLRETKADRVVLLCADWQRAFYEQVLDTFHLGDRPQVEVVSLPPGFLDAVDDALEQKWGVA